MTRDISSLFLFSPPELVVTDGDGTLMDDGSFLPSSITALEEMMRHTRAEVVIASARPYHQLYSLIEQTTLQPYLDDRLHIGGFNGNHAMYKGHLLRAQTLPPTTIERVVKAFPGNEKVFFTQDKITSPNPHTPWLTWYAAHTGYDLQQSNHLDPATYMMEIKVPLDSNIQETSCEVQLFTPPFSHPPEQAQWAQYTAKGGKLAMTKKYAEIKGIPLSKVVCIGDGKNDNEMILHPETIGIAMGNNSLEAPHIYKTKRVEEDGFANAMRYVFT